jgi:hypothetical protein
VVGDEGAYALADALGGARLQRLDLRRTEIGGRGAPAAGGGGAGAAGAGAACR